MYKITNYIIYAGVDDHDVDLFEGQYRVPEGMSYNSYVIVGEKIAVTDTVDSHFVDEWLENIDKATAGKAPDYLIVHHMEPDHSAGIARFAEKYPEAKIVGNAKTFGMIANFFDIDIESRKVVVKEGDVLDLGGRTLTFVFAPMVHWPEVMISFDSESGALFSADAFGRFGASDATSSWVDEGRRYYIGIVGKYGIQVQNVLKKAAGLPIKMICPLHGPVLKDDIGRYIKLYDVWSSYRPEKKGVVIAYTSVYGHTEKAALGLFSRLKVRGVEVTAFDLARCDMSEAVAEAFACDRLVLATTTYNGGIFPFMREFIDHLNERNFRERTVAFIENGSWAPMATKVMKDMLAGCKDIRYTEAGVRILSSVNEANEKELDALAAELCG